MIRRAFGRALGYVDVVAPMLAAATAGSNLAQRDWVGFGLLAAVAAAFGFVRIAERDWLRWQASSRPTLDRVAPSLLREHGQYVTLVDKTVAHALMGPNRCPVLLSATLGSDGLLELWPVYLTSGAIVDGVWVPPPGGGGGSGRPPSGATGHAGVDA